MWAFFSCIHKWNRFEDFKSIHQHTNYHFSSCCEWLEIKKTYNVPISQMICGFCFDAEVHVAFLWRIRMKPLEWSSWNMNHIASSTYFASTRQKCTNKSEQFLLFTILVSLVKELLSSKKTLYTLWVCDQSSTPAKLHFVSSLKGESYWNQAKKFISYMKPHIIHMTQQSNLLNSYKCTGINEFALTSGDKQQSVSLSYSKVVVRRH